MPPIFKREIMILEQLENKSPNAKVWDSKKGKILFTFKDGKFETDDEYIIKFWSLIDSRLCPPENIGDGKGTEEPKKEKTTN